MSDLIERLRAEADDWWDQDDEGCPSTIIREAASAIATLRRENQALRKAVEWQPIETATQEGEILALSPAYSDGPLVLRWFKYNGKAGWRDWDGDLHFPTHWLALPPPPAAALGQKPSTQGEPT